MSKKEEKATFSKKHARKLANNIELYCNKRTCPICGCEPEKQVKMIHQALDAAREEVLEEYRLHFLKIVSLLTEKQKLELATWESLKWGDGKMLVNPKNQ